MIEKAILTLGTSIGNYLFAIAAIHAEIEEDP